MPRKGEYSDKYGFHNSSLVFNCGGEAVGHAGHGTLTTEGIDGAQPRRFTAERAPAPWAQEVQDEVGIRTKVRLPAHPRNPLDPDYHLPTVAPPPEVPSKFLKDTLDVSDIQGAQKRSAKQPSKERRSLLTSDIEGSQPGWKAHRPKAAGIDGGAARRQDNLNVSDIASNAAKPALHPRSEELQEKARAETGIGTQKNMDW
jgi:hypothetical protein